LAEHGRMVHVRSRSSLSDSSVVISLGLNALGALN
jgi:hypothetical protein